MDEIFKLGLQRLPILNLTQHPAVEDQRRDDVKDHPDPQKIRDLITFYSVPTKEEMIKRAEALVQETKNLGYEKVMIGGAPYFMPILEKTLLEDGITVCYAFSHRICHETPLPDGTVKKEFFFMHGGFYTVKPDE